MNAMSTNPSISVEVIPGGMDSDGHESFEVKFAGDPVGDEAVPSLTAKARTVWFGERVVFVVVDTAKFKNVPEDNKIEFLLMVPKAITRLRHIRAEMIPVFNEDLAEDVPYLNQISVSTESIEGTRMALANFVEEADQNLVKRGYFFHPAEIPPPPAAAVFSQEIPPPRPDLGPEAHVAEGFQKQPTDTAGGSNEVDPSIQAQAIAVPAVVTSGEVAEGFEKKPADIAGGSNEVSPTPPADASLSTSRSAVAVAGDSTTAPLADLPTHTDVVDEAVNAPTKKMKFGYDEAQLMLVGANEAALGEGVTIDFRSKVNGEKFEVIAIDSIQTVGVELDTALGLAFGALRLIKRTSELPLEMGMTKAGCEVLCAQIEGLEDNSKLNSHLGIHLIDAEYVATKVAAASEAGYVAALEE